MKGSRKAVALSRSAGGWSLGQRFTLAHGHPVTHSTPARAPVTHSTVVFPANLLSRYFCCSPSSTGESKAEPSSATNSHVLLYASQEAERVLQLASAKGRDLSPESATDSLNAANALLLVSNPSNTLVDCILHKSSASQIGSIHRAFLAMISWCLDTVQLKEETADVEQQTVTLEAALSLARRAHDLRLPLHIPLYKRLMDTFATGKHDASIGSPVQLITEIASWVVITLDAPIDASLFRSCLCRLVEGRSLSEAHELLMVMKFHYGIELLDIETTTDVLLALRTIVDQEVSYSQSTSHESMTYPAIHEEDVFDIVAFLEASLINIFSDTYSSEPDMMREKMKTLRGKLGQDEFEYLLEFLVDRIGDEEEKEKDADDDDSFNNAFRNILTKRVRNVNAKAMLSDWVKHHYSGTHESVLSQPHLKAAGSFVDGENSRVYHAFTSESDERDIGSRMAPSEIIYSRGHDLPDVTAQIEHLNGGQEVLFTREFEDILWSRDYAEDVSLLESMVGRPRLDEATDSDGDSDDYSEDDSDDDQDY